MSSPEFCPVPPPGDAEIVRLLLCGEPAGLRLLLEGHGPRVRGCLRRSLTQLSESDMDDVMNKAAYRAWRGVTTYSPQRGSLRAWFFVIARNAALETLRERQRRPLETRGSDIEQVAMPADAPEAPAPAAAFLETLHRCIEALPPKQRQIIRADLQSGDIADAGELAANLDTTRNSIYVLRSLARKTLRRALTENGCVPGDDSEPIAVKRNGRRP